MNNTFNDFFHAITDVMVAERGIFEPTGLALLRLITVLLLVFFGSYTLLMGHFDMRRFLRMAAGILTLQMALTYYSAPSPVFGISFTHLITDETHHLSDTLSLASESATLTFDNLTAIYQATNLSWPLLPSPSQLIRYTIMLLVLSFLEAIIWAVIAFGFIAVAVLIIVGPILLPFAIFPGLEWIAWGWIKCFIQFSFYEVVGGAYLLISARVLTYFIGGYTPPYAAATTWSMILPAIMMAGALAYGAVQIPSLTSSIFSGRAGEAAIPRFLRWS